MVETSIATQPIMPNDNDVKMDDSSDDSSEIHPKESIQDDVIEIAIPPRQSVRRAGFKLSEMAHTSGSMFRPPSASPDVTVTKRQFSQKTLDNVAVKRARLKNLDEEALSEEEDVVLDEHRDTEKNGYEDGHEFSDTQEALIERTVYRTNGDIWDTIEDEGAFSVVTDTETVAKRPEPENCNADIGYHQSISTSRVPTKKTAPDMETEVQGHAVEDALDDNARSTKMHYEQVVTDEDVIASTDRPYLDTRNFSISVDLDASDLLKRYKQRTRIRYNNAGERISRPAVPLMNANIANTTDNGQATKVLDRVIKKSDFEKMQVVGQFNLGFIIATLNEADLFIIDQHASDEKFNFETLQQTTQIKGQKLIQ